MDRLDQTAFDFPCDGCGHRIQAGTTIRVIGFRASHDKLPCRELARKHDQAGTWSRPFASEWEEQP